MIRYKTYVLFLLAGLIACQPARILPASPPPSTVEILPQSPLLETATLIPYPWPNSHPSTTQYPEPLLEPRDTGMPYPLPGATFPAPYPSMGTPVPWQPLDINITRLITATIYRLPEIGQGISAYDFIDERHGWVATGLGWGEGSGNALLATQDGGQNWTILSNEIGFSKDLDFISQKVGWRIAGFGKLHATHDGGLTWTAVPLGLSDDCAIQVQFVDMKNGWVIDCMNNLDRTKDGGKTWSIQAGPERLWPIHLVDFYFTNPFQGWSIISRDSLPYQPSELLATHDGGVTWQSVYTSTSDVDAPSIKGEASFLKNEHGWLTGNGNLYESRDGGASWQLLYKRTEPFISYPLIMTEELGYVLVGSGGGGLGQVALMKTGDGGNTWAQVFPPLFPLEEIQFFDASSGVGIGTVYDVGATLKTIDGGRTWQVFSSLGPIIYTVLYMNFQDPQNGWVSAQDCPDPQSDCGNIGYYQTMDGGLTWKRFDETEFASLPYPKPRFYDSAKQFVDSEIGWLITDGTLSATRDGGNTWSTLLSGIEARQLSLLSADEGWVLGRSRVYQGFRPPKLLHTSDGGQSWEIYHLEGIVVDTIRFSDPLNGWIRGGELEHRGMKGGYIYGNNHIYITHDGGQTWEQLI